MQEKKLTDTKNCYQKRGTAVMSVKHVTLALRPRGKQ